MPRDPGAYREGARDHTLTPNHPLLTDSLPPQYLQHLSKIISCDYLAMASLKRKRDTGPRNSFRASSAQRRFATDPVNPIRLRPISPDVFNVTTGLEHVQTGGRRGVSAVIDEIDEDENLMDDSGEVVMAVDIKEKGTVGCCFYIAREEKLSILSDVQFGGKDFIDMRELSLSKYVLLSADRLTISVKLEINPTTILTSTRAEEATIINIQNSGA